jgi:DNA-binding response OmpR family regulator
LENDHLILICDDDILVTELVQFRLEAKGYAVAVAADGEEALEKAAAEKPSLIVLDAMMPKLDGFQTLSRLKSDPELKDIPVIMLTARKGEKDIVSALEKGAEDYLVKPFIPDELIVRLARILSKR